MTELNVNHSTFSNGTSSYAKAISDNSDHESPRNENRLNSKLVIVEPTEDRSDESFQNESYTENNERLTSEGNTVSTVLVKSEIKATCNPPLSIKIPFGRYEITKVSKPQINLRATSMISPTQKVDNGHVNFVNVAKPRSTPAREAVDPAKYYILNDEPDGTKYACSKCGNVYKWRKSLNKHWKEKHEGEAPPSLVERERMLKCPPQNFPKHSVLQVTPTINSAKSVLFPATAVSLSNFKSTNQIRIPTNLYTLVNVCKTAEAEATNRSHVGYLQSSHPPNTTWMPHNIRKDYKDVSPAHQGNFNKYKNSITSSKPVYDDCGALDLSINVSLDQDMPLDFSSKSSNAGGWSEDESIPNDLRTKLVLSNHEDQDYTCFQCQLKFNQIFDLNSHFTCQHMNSLYELADNNISTLDSKDPPGCLSSKKCSTDNEGLIQCVICGFTEKWDWQMFKHFDSEHYGIEPNPYKTLSINYTDPKNISNSIPDSPVESSGNNSLNAEMLKKFGLSDNSVLDLESQGTAIVIPKAPEETALHVRYSTHRQKSQDLFTEEGTAYPMTETIEEPTSENARVSFGGKSGRGKKDSSLFVGDVVLPYECKLCGYRARWPSEMTQHMKNHSDEKPYQCPQCSYRSKWKWDVVKHLKRCGGNKDQSESAQKRKRTFPKAFPEISSSESNNESFSNGKLSDHREVLSRGPPNITLYSNDRPKKRYYEGSTSPQDAEGLSNEHHSNLHPCEQCYFVGHSPAELRRHMRVHSDEKPYSCNTCNYSSKWKCDLKKHLRTYNHVPAVPMDQAVSKKSSDSQDIFDGSMTSQEDKTLGGEVFAEGMLKCRKCSYEATNMTAYIEHVSKHAVLDSYSSDSKQFLDENENSEMDTESRKMKLMFSLGLYQVTSDDSSQPITETTVNLNASNEKMNCENGFFKYEGEHNNQIFHENTGYAETENNSTENDILDCSTRNGGPLNNSKFQEAPSSDCKVSSKLFTLQELTINSVRLRLIIKSDRQFYGCLKCPYVSCSSFRVVYHSRQHGLQKNFKCTFCDYSNDQLTFIQKHTTSLHGEENNNNFRKSSDFCLKKIDHFRILSKMNLKLRKNICISCGYASLSKTSMIKHRLTRPCSQLLIKHPMNEHAGNIFSCNKCSFRTDEQLTMVNHSKDHDSDHKHKCLKCDFSSSLMNVILTHRRQHHR